MDPKSSFAIKLLEKIGAPLIKAVEKPASASSEENAEVVARLLGQAVKMSIALNSTLGVEENEAQADSTRMALAAIVSPLLADHYETHKKEPEEQDVQRIIKSLEVVMSFADKFKPAEEGQSRLTTIDHTTPFFDETQGVLNTMLAMTPVIPAIYEFSFGHPENKLMQDVAAKLEAKAQELAGDNKVGQILVLQALANIYADCHRAATAQMAQSDGDARQGPTMDPVWEDFYRRALMLSALGGGENSGASSAGSSSMPIAPIPVEPPVEEPAAAPVENAAPPAGEAQAPSIFSSGPTDPPAEAPNQIPSQAVAEQPVPEAATLPVAPVAEPAPIAEQPAASTGGGGPMSFFTKGDDKPAPPAAAAPATPPATPPPAAPPAQPTTTLPPTTPTEPPKDVTSSNFADSGKQDESGNPMSFFGKKTDGE